jgi:hypothetical protein
MSFENLMQAGKTLQNGYWRYFKSCASAISPHRQPLFTKILLTNRRSEFGVVPLDLWHENK